MMFERFDAQARQAVDNADAEARRLHHNVLGPEHLLLGVATQPASPGGAALEACGLVLEILRQRVAAEVGLGHGPFDTEALAIVGIDIDAVRQAAETSFGPGALDRQRENGRNPYRLGRRLPFGDPAKQSVKLALKAALSLHDDRISTGHLLLGLLDQGNNPAVRILTKAGIDQRALREQVVAQLRRAA